MNNHERSLINTHENTHEQGNNWPCKLDQYNFLCTDDESLPVRQDSYDRYTT